MESSQTSGWVGRSSAGTVIIRVKKQKFFIFTHSFSSNSSHFIFLLWQCCYLNFEEKIRNVCVSEISSFLSKTWNRKTFWYRYYNDFPWKGGRGRQIEWQRDRESERQNENECEYDLLSLNRCLSISNVIWQDREITLCKQGC